MPLSYGMRLWKKKGKKEPEETVIELFPNQPDSGPTIMVSKERGVADAIVETARKLEPEVEKE